MWYIAVWIDFVVDDSHSIGDDLPLSTDNDSIPFGHERLASLFDFYDSDDERSTADSLKRTADAIVDRARKRRFVGTNRAEGGVSASGQEPTKVMYVVRCKV